MKRKEKKNFDFAVIIIIIIIIIVVFAVVISCVYVCVQAVGNFFFLFQTFSLFFRFFSNIFFLSFSISLPLPWRCCYYYSPVCMCGLCLYNNNHRTNEMKSPFQRKKKKHQVEWSFNIFFCSFKIASYSKLS